MNALSSRRKVIILISCCLSLLIVSMDATIVNVAIPSIRTELHASASELQADLTVTAPVWAVVAIFAVFGAGFAMANAPITTTAVSGMPTDRAGAASAVASTSRQVGVSIGVALCGSLAGAALTSSTAQYTADARPLWLTCAILGLAIITLATWSTSRRAIRSAERLAPLIAGPAERQENACAA